MSTSTPEQPRRALTVTDVMRGLQGWIDRDPKYADYPVMILDMRGDETGDDEVCDGLVTDIEPDMFTVEQGNVMLLSSDPLPTARAAANLAKAKAGGQLQS